MSALPQQVKICVVSKSDINGGAPRASYRLFRALQAQHASVEYLVQEKAVEDSHIHVIDSGDCEATKHDQWLIDKYYINNNKSEYAQTIFTATLGSVDLAENELMHGADVINLHWIEKFISLNTLRYILSLGKPVVWTLHDQRPFTGGCHYTTGCEGFVESMCHPCIQLNVDECLLPHRVVTSMREIVKDANVAVISPSRWLAEEAGKSAVFHDKPVYVIPNSVETDIFYPRKQAGLREKYGIPENAFVILAGANSNKERRKGFEEFKHSMMQCLDEEGFLNQALNNEVVVITFGTKSQSIAEGKLCQIDFGCVDNDDELAELYSLADTFVITSLQDNLPNTILESMACGTPVIGFEVGGVPELVKDGHNGRLVPKGDLKALSEIIISLSRHREVLSEYGVNAESTIRNNHTQALQSSRYLELFENLRAVKQSTSVSDGFDIREVLECALEYSREKNQIEISERNRSQRNTLLLRFNNLARKIGNLLRGKPG